MTTNRLVLAVLVAMAVLAGGCGGASSELAVPAVYVSNSGTSQVSPSFLNAGLEGAVPAGVQVAFIGDVVALRGENFSGATKAFLGMNHDLARRPDSLLTTVRHLLPDKPFVYTDPVTATETILEIETKVEYTSNGEIRIVIPPGVACHSSFSNPIVRLYGGAGSSFPRTDALFIIGPRSVATAPNKGADIGGYDVTLHGDFFSPFTQIVVRWKDPTTGEIMTLGDTVETDIDERFIDRYTLVIQSWPGVVPDSTRGLARDLAADILFYESIDDIMANSPLEAGQGGTAPCDSLSRDGDIQLSLMGVRNQTKIGAFTYTPTGTTDYPSIAGIVPESGTELGGNTVIIRGDQFDAFTTDIDTDPGNPGIGIECPPGSGSYIRPLKAILVDRQTLVVVMPPCAVDVPEKVNFALRNKFSIEEVKAGNTPPPATGPAGDAIIFEEIYTYNPIPPIVPPLVKAIYPATEGQPQPNGSGNDHGLQRFMVIGDWFDASTTLNGGFEFILPDRAGLAPPTPEGGNPRIVQALRVILHNRNLIEVFTRPLPEPWYPLNEKIEATVRVRNVVGESDFENAFTFLPTPAAEFAPVITTLCPTEGPHAGGNEVMIVGENFDTATRVFFGAAESGDVRFLGSGLLVATAPQSGSTQAELDVDLVVENGIGASAPATYTYTENPDPSYDAPALGALDPDEGSLTGGYAILAYGANLSPLTRVEFGVDLEQDPIQRSGNFAPAVSFLSTNLLLVTVPRAFDDQIGATIGVGASDPLGGHDTPVKTVDFKYTPRPDGIPLIAYVDTSVEVPPAPTTLPALSMSGGDRMLVIGKHFDQETTFDIEKPQGSGDSSDATNIIVLSPNIAVMTSPASPDSKPGTADLQAHNSVGDSNEFAVDYVQPGPPEIVDVRNLDDGTQTSPIDANDRLIVFGDNFVAPLTVTLRGFDLQNQSDKIDVTLKSEDGEVTLVEDHLIGINVPPNVFAQGPLEITVTTPFGETMFADAQGDPIFALIGPQPPKVTGVFESRFLSHGGEEAIFFGRNFTKTSAFSVRTSPMAPGQYVPVLEATYVSETVFLVLMPPLPGGMPPAGVPGDVRAEETDPVLVTKIAPVSPVTFTEEIFTVRNDDQPVLYAIYPDTGSIAGGEQVLLLGNDFLKADGTPNLSAIRFFEFGTTTDVGTYSEALAADLPLDSTDPANRGKYYVINTHQILLITNPHEKIIPEDAGAPVDVKIESTNGDTILNGGYTYFNIPPVRTPMLLSIVANETRWNGGTSHLLSGAFLTEADRIVFKKGGETLTIPVDKGMFSEVNDNFLTFLMPDLRPKFEEGAALDVYVEKDFEGSVLKSNVLTLALKVTFAGPPTITPTLTPPEGSAFGGEVIEIKGSFFTTNSQVLFGTIPARHVVYMSPTQLMVISPALPASVPGPLDLLGITDTNGKVDVAVYTQGGWAVLKEGYQFKPETPIVDSCTDDPMPEGATVRVEVLGNFFVPGGTTVTPLAAGGTVSNLVVRSYTELSFDYTAPSFPAGEDGPFLDKLTVATTQGGPAAQKCELTIHPDPELDDCKTTYTINDQAAPTTGVEGGNLVKTTVKGRNFVEGGKLWVTTRVGKQPIALTEVGTFTAGGQFMVDDKNQVTFTVPYVFPDKTPTLVDGNPNVGPADIRYENPFLRGADLKDCFSYVPALLSFERFAFTLPNTGAAGFVSQAQPQDVKVGDINADGVPDVAVLGAYPEFAWVLWADTFGDVDVNGDGKKPDFAGTFTREAITFSLQQFSVFWDVDNRSNEIGLAQLDGDPELEILLPGGLDPLPNNARIAVQDVDSTGLTTVTLLVPPTTESWDVANLAVGDFDGDSRDDFAYMTKHLSDESKRRLIIVTSPVTAFTFVQKAYALHASAADFIPSKLAAGDWDGNGIDDLIYGFSGGFPVYWVTTPDDFRVIVVKIDGSGGVTSQTAVKDLAPRNVHQIVVVDADDDGKEDAIVLWDDEAKSNPLFLPGIARTQGFGIILDPLKAGGPTLTSFQVTNLTNRFATAGDVNGDGIPDLILPQPGGDFTVYFGDGKGDFVDSGQSWLNVTLPAMTDPYHAVAAGDFNNDGLAEILFPDAGQTPRKLILWLNTSR